MGAFNLPPVEPRGNRTLEEYLRYLADVSAIHRDELEHLLGGNVNFQNIQVEGIQAKNIKAGAVTAEKISVNELSAISANMGTITAGSITTDAEINVGTDARIGDTLYLNETDGDSQKGIVFSTATGKTASISALQGDLSVNSAGFITLTIGSSQGLVVNQKITAPHINATSAVTVNNEYLATESFVNNGLAGKANAFTGYTGSVSTGTQTLVFSNGILTSVF